MALDGGDIILKKIKAAELGRPVVSLEAGLDMDIRKGLQPSEATDPLSASHCLEGAVDLPKGSEVVWV